MGTFKKISGGGSYSSDWLIKIYQSLFPFGGLKMYLPHSADNKGNSEQDLVLCAS